MSYDISIKDTEKHEKPACGALYGIKNDHCAEQVLRALIHAGYEVTIKEKHEQEKVECSNSACEPQIAVPPPAVGRGF